MPEQPADSSRTEPLLSRWSRLKLRGSEEKNSIASESEKPLSPKDINGYTSDAVDHSGRVVEISKPNAAEPVSATEPALPPLESINLQSDFTPFMQAKVPEALKRQALKTLFKETHFNTMDGLDIYIGDYTQFEPISPEEMAGMSAWKAIAQPMQQVVTPGGYAVDVESEEGKAVLAAREAELQVPSPAAPDVCSRAAGEGVNARYGKRVGDFNADSFVQPEPVVALVDDPR